jgi:hypothetical protein
MLSLLEGITYRMMDKGVRLLNIEKSVTPAQLLWTMRRTFLTIRWTLFQTVGLPIFHNSRMLIVQNIRSLLCQAQEDATLTVRERERHGDQNHPDAV